MSRLTFIFQSLNPAIDMGQIEGAYVQGQGLFTLEETMWSQQGRMLTKGPGAYKIPGFCDIPQTFNVRMEKTLVSDREHLT